MARLGRNEKCPCGSGRKYKRCCEDIDRGASLRASLSPPPGFLQLVIETGNGLCLRNVPPAMPLRLRESVGKEAEAATHGAAATWGLADFVFEPQPRQLSSGVRELGDGLVLVGDLGLVLQVKCREAISDDVEREKKWVLKQAAKALRQASGTIRQLRLAPAPMTNFRGRTVEVDGKDFRWIRVVVIDHDDVPERVEVAVEDDAVVVLRRDWEFLFDQLKSTHAVGRYLDRVAGEPQTLGTESIRYYEYAAADEAAAPTPLKPEFQLPGIAEGSEPLLPMAPAASESWENHALFRSILEDIAAIKLDEMSEATRLRALADLDRVPVVQRGEVGRYLRTCFESALTVSEPEVRWHLRRISGAFGTTQLGFGVCSTFSDEIQWAFGTWLELRHHEFTQRLGTDEPVTVGVLITPRLDGSRPWDTTMSALSGPIDLTPEELEAFKELWRDERDVLMEAA